MLMYVKLDGGVTPSLDGIMWFLLQEDEDEDDDGDDDYEGDDGDDGDDAQNDEVGKITDCWMWC